MWRIAILLVSVPLVFAQGSNSSGFPYWQKSWIQGGKVAHPGEFPFMVSVRNRRTTELNCCGGSIVNSWYILTAAHCVSDATPPNVKIVIGTNQMHRGGRVHDVIHIILHHDHEGFPEYNDIALLKLKAPLFYNSRIQPVRLPNQGEKTYPNTPCIMMGWGYTHATATSMSEHLMNVKLYTISNDECKRYYPHKLDKKICTSAATGKGTCKGDSGGPLICGGKLIGVLIWKHWVMRDSKCSSPLPSTYVYVPKYIDWIRNNAIQ